VRDYNIGNHVTAVRLKMASKKHPSPKEITRLLVAWSNGDQEAFDKLVPLVYDELHQRARRYLRKEQRGHVLQTTALVHEAYLRLIDARSLSWQNRAHFFAIAARLMRRILVDYARSRHYVRRGGEARHVPLEEASMFSHEKGPDLVALDDALQALATIDRRKSDVIELRFFGGLSVDETAEVLKVSADTVMRDWRLARSWLLHELSPHENGEAQE
jgi:RNA polymerase sigma factor (TIGR02999 family)